MKRREFLRQSTVQTAAFAALPYGIPRSRIFQDRQLGVALVGLGYYSTDLLAPALQLTNHCKLTGIVTGSPSKIPVWQEKYNIPDKNVYNYDNFDNIANNPAIDVIYIVLPPSMHAEYSIRAANAGKHVWCEKPMAVTAKECQDMIQACQSNKVKLSIGYRLHHEPVTKKITQFAKNEHFGIPRMVSVAAGYFDGRSDHWKQKKEMGGGVMYDMGVYPLNAARYAVGQEPIGVMAQHFTNRPEIYTDVDETTLFQLEFPNGAVANCATSFGMNMNYLYTTFSKGWYRVEPFSAYSGVKGICSDGTSLDPMPEGVPYEQVRQMDSNAQAILNDQDVLVPGEEGWKDIRVVEAIYQSAKEGKRIEIPPID